MVGGGLIGVEVAEILHHRGLHVTFVVRERWRSRWRSTRPRRRSWRSTCAAGIDVRLGRSCARSRAARTGAWRPSRWVRRADGGGGDARRRPTWWCAIGVVPRTGFLAGQRASRSPRTAGIETDDALRTTAPDVWAAGDCANVTSADGRRRLEQLWYTAREQGRAGRAARCWATPSSTGAARASTRPSSSTSSGRRRARCPRRPRRTGERVPLPAGVRCWFQRVPGRLASQRVVVREGPGDRLQHAGLALGPRAARSSGSPSGARSTGCWTTSARRSSTRSSSRGSACMPPRAGRGPPDAGRPAEHLPAAGEQPLVARVVALGPAGRGVPAPLLRPDPRARPATSTCCRSRPSTAARRSACRRRCTASGCSTAAPTRWR